MTDDTNHEEAVEVEVVNNTGYEIIEDLGDAIALTKNGRAKVTENNRGHA